MKHVNTKVLIGSAADKIVEFASNENIDIMIIGNIGLGGMSKLKYLGSVSRYVRVKEQNVLS